MKFPISQKQQGLTRFDVVAIVGLVLFLVYGALYFLLPRLAVGDRSFRTECAAAMKQVALGFILWANDLGDQALPFRVAYEKGGLMNPGSNKINIEGIGQFDPTLRSNAWLQFAFINKELQDPKILVCPADRKRKIATAWGNTADGGFTHPKYQNNAVSYCIGLDAGPKFLEGVQTTVLLSERHMEYDAVDDRCSAKVGLTKMIRIRPGGGTNSVNVSWKNKNPRLHEGGGNIALMDGSTHKVNARQLKEFLAQPPYDDGSLHFIYP